VSIDTVKAFSGRNFVPSTFDPKLPVFRENEGRNVTFCFWTTLCTFLCEEMSLDVLFRKIGPRPNWLYRRGSTQKINYIVRSVCTRARPRGWGANTHDWIVMKFCTWIGSPTSSLRPVFVTIGSGVFRERGSKFSICSCAVVL